MKLNAVTGLLLLCILTSAVLIAGCTSSTTNNTSATSAANATIAANVQNLGAALDAHFAAQGTIFNNFGLTSTVSSSPVYSGAFQDYNGTLHVVTISVANSSADSQGKFEDQKENYVDIAASPNASITANTTTHWAVVSANSSISIWTIQPKAVGPFSLSLDSPYVLVSVDTKPPMTTLT